MKISNFTNFSYSTYLVTDSICITFNPLKVFLILRAGISPNLPLIFNLLSSAYRNAILKYSFVNGIGDPSKFSPMNMLAITFSSFDK